MSASNQDEYEIIIDEYCDCHGEPFCVARKEIVPPELPLLLAPLDFPFDIGAVDFTNTQIVEGLKYTKRFKALMQTRYPLKVNTIFSTPNNTVRYYLKRYVRRTPYNFHEYEVKRADCSELVPSDFNNLVKGNRIFARGYFVNEK